MNGTRIFLCTFATNEIERIYDRYLYHEGVEKTHGVGSSMKKAIYGKELL